MNLPPPDPNQLQLGKWLSEAGYHYSCFLSWSHCASDHEKRAILQLKKAIEEESKRAGLPPKVFFDEEEIGAGALWEARITDALMRSCALIAICGPDYHASPYCGREWAGMADLRDALTVAALIPVELGRSVGLGGYTFRHEQVYPAPIGERQIVDFSSIGVRTPNFEAQPLFDKNLGKIMRALHDVALALYASECPAQRPGFFVPTVSAFADFNKPVSRVPTAGVITTFYSFKGGVGRSMALANIARIIGRDNPRAKVLSIDWDLDAPGLEKYFGDAPRDEGHHGIGLVGYLESAIKALGKNGSPPFRAEDMESRFPLTGVVEPTGVERLWLLPATGPGRRVTRDYRRAVSAIDWMGLFDKHQDWIRAFRDLLARNFTHILIDSRTGVSDVSGFCTALLPDQLVAMVPPNQHNSHMLEIVEEAVQFRRAWDPQRELRVFPLASRFDPGELDGFQRALIGWRDQFSALFRPLYHTPDCNLDQYFRHALLVYVPHYAGGGRVVVDLDEPNHDGSLRSAYERFAKVLTAGKPPWEY